MEAISSDVAFLVVGDPFGAPTHTDLVVRAKKLGVVVEVVHNASVMNALEFVVYNYTDMERRFPFRSSLILGSLIVSMRRFRKFKTGIAHSLLVRCTSKGTFTGVFVQPPRYMTISIAIEQLLEVEELRGENAYTEDTTCVGFARLGSEDQLVVAGSMKQLLEVDFGPPLHCLVIVGDTHPVEEEMRDFYKLVVAIA
ncbi:hypothetical protein ACH5RR_035229 [Cinchona calisaya]|uniref:Diphthine methyl ester synthase n=1 Tax=Cinchona calisaya TaxID=153742 RepID=A0ABD2YEC2_9GENT